MVQVSARTKYPRRAPSSCQASETSDLRAASGSRHRGHHAAADALLIVDGITAVGVIDLPMDRLGIDVLITGSQKALMLPPRARVRRALGARLGGVRAREATPASTFDFRRERKGVAEKSTAWTPAISLIQGLRVALAMMRAEGWRTSTRVTIGSRARRAPRRSRSASVSSRRSRRARRRRRSCCPSASTAPRSSATSATACG
jgi:hypothetical protein